MSGSSLILGAILILTSVALIVGLRPPARIARFVDSLWTTRAGTVVDAKSRG